MAEIKWNNGVEDANKIEIEKFLNPLLWFIPKWCQQITINVYASDDDAAVSTLVDYEYRKVAIDFYGSWFIQDDKTKRDNVIHELVHIFVNELYHQARRVIQSTL